MPKRKSEQSVDEWLEDGLVAAEVNRMLVEPNRSEGGSCSGPTAEAMQTVASEPRTEEGALRPTPGHVAELTAEVATVSIPPTEAEVAGPVGDETITPEAAEKWFWRLLAQAGYEPL